MTQDRAREVFEAARKSDQTCAHCKQKLVWGWNEVSRHIGDTFQHTYREGCIKAATEAADGRVAELEARIKADESLTHRCSTHDCGICYDCQGRRAFNAEHQADARVEAAVEKAVKDRCALEVETRIVGIKAARLEEQIKADARVEAEREACIEACTDERYAGPIATHPVHRQANNAVHNQACDDCAAAILKRGEGE